MINVPYIEGPTMQRVTIFLLAIFLTGCLLGVETFYLESSPVAGQDSSYSISDGHVIWNGFRTEFVVNNQVVLRQKVTKIGEFSDWDDTPTYSNGGQTPVSITMWFRVRGAERILIDTGSVKLTLEGSRTLSPTIASRTVCSALRVGEVEYSQPSIENMISLANPPHTYKSTSTSEAEGCIRFIFDLTVEKMDPSKSFSLTVKFVMNGTERTETIYFSPREYRFVNA